MGYIKNIPHENRLRLAEQVSIQPGQVVSKTLAQNKAVSLTILHLIRMKKSVPMHLMGMPW